MEDILRGLAFEDLPRDEETMTRLMTAIEHPAQLSESPYLTEEDPLKTEAVSVLEDFEAVTNGMRRPASGTETGFRREGIDPLLPWRLLTEAAAAFYSGDTALMMRLFRSIPPDTAPARLSDVFDALSGRPASGKKDDGFSGRLLRRPADLVLALEDLEEAAAYPDLLGPELSRILPAMMRQETEDAARLALWGMERIAAERPLTSADEAMTAALGSAESARLRALASLETDPDRALLAWLVSLARALSAPGFPAAEAAARLSIAREIHRKALDDGLMSVENAAAALGILKGCRSDLERTLRSLPSLPAFPEELAEWLDGVGGETADHRLPAAPLQRRRSGAEPGPMLFEVSA